MAQQFIGVYATNEKTPSPGEFPRPMARRKRLWFVWETSEGKYKVQALNAVFQPMAAARLISPREFGERFVPETDCNAVPEGDTRPVSTAAETARPVDAEGASLPDLFLGGEASLSLPARKDFSMPHSSHGTAVLRADDPNLLMAWAKDEIRPKREFADPVRIPFDRLVSEVVETTPEEAGASAGPVTDISGNRLPAATPVSSLNDGQSAAPDDTDAEQVRLLRSQFVQALLLMRRGARTESIALLHDMLNKPHTFFQGGAQLFSEFGLGLRRLGLASLALAAHRRALEFAPRDERILFNIARSYHDLDLLAEARDYLEQALAVAPEFTAAKQFLAFIEGKTAR